METSSCCAAANSRVSGNKKKRDASRNVKEVNSNGLDVATPLKSKAVKRLRLKKEAEQGKRTKVEDNNSVISDVQDSNVQDANVCLTEVVPFSNPETEDVVSTDAYLLSDSVFCTTALNDIRWTNKQRTLVFSSRGVSHRQRHFLEDLKKLLPHSKSEPKWEKKATLTEINEICEMHSCNNCIFLETRKNTELYMWLAKTPMGPSVRFQVLNIHTLGELRMTGNCLLHSRPLLVFDRAFNRYPYLRLMKEMFVQAFGTPKNHPKAKPFYDHVFSFCYHDHKIWFRHYQIAPTTERDANKPLRQTLTEIGPRFVLDPIKIFEDSFTGRVLYQNPHYLSPTSIRVLASRGIGSKYAARKASEHARKIRFSSVVIPQDFLDRTVLFSDPQSSNKNV